MGMGMELRRKAEMGVTTLALGSRPRQGLARLWVKKEAQESHCLLLGM